ncbi:uncharacterized protein LOC143359990 [Halictus rubicundus]|uniref:uncharacterized protein LOC143359990 n=1 Tax=Halictus rubicundus TaxID=77578 RepID=UPI004037302C
MLISKSRSLCTEHELKGPFNRCLLDVLEQKARNLREFLAKANNYRQENDRAKIGYKPKVNNETRELNEERIMEIKIQREKEWSDYKNLLENHIPEEDIFERQKSRKIKQRILRLAHKLPKIVSTAPKVEQSFLHYYIITPFVQAARKIILRNRLLRVLERLKNLTPELTNESENVTTY